MAENILMQNFDPLSMIQNRLLMNKLPYYFPGIEIDAARLNPAVLSGFFFETIHPTPHLIDLVIGEIKGETMSAFTMAIAMKMSLLRLGKPIFRGHHFDKTQLWEKGTLPLQEIIKMVTEELEQLLKDLNLSAHLFYGRVNLEYNTFSYLDCGFTTPIYYSQNQLQAVLLNGSCPPIGSLTKHEYTPAQMCVEPGDCLIFHSDYRQPNLEGINVGLDQNRLISLIEKYYLLKPCEISKYIYQEMVDSSKENERQSATVVIFKLTDDRPSQSFKQTMAKFASDLSQLSAVRAFVQCACQQTPGDCDKLNLQMQFVINEIFCNVVKHSYYNKPKGEIIIESQLKDNGIYFTISDQGNPFDPTETKHPNLSGDQQDGFGVFIIQQMADHLSYTPKTSEDGWNHLRIFKRYFSEENQLDFSYAIQDHILTIKPKGENLDAKTAPIFKENVLSLIQTSKLSHLIFDLKNLQFIDSSGLGTFLAIQQTLNAQGGLLKLANLNKPIRTMFEIVSMHRIFDISPSVEEAILSFNF